MKWRSLEESTTGTDTRPLRDIFAEREELIARYVPPETQAVHARVIPALKGRHLAASVLAVGAKAPHSNFKTTTASRFLRMKYWVRAAW